MLWICWETMVVGWDGQVLLALKARIWLPGQHLIIRYIHRVQRWPFQVFSASICFQRLCRLGWLRNLVLEWNRSSTYYFLCLQAILHRAEQLVGAICFRSERMRRAVNEHLATLPAHLTLSVLVDRSGWHEELVERLKDVALGWFFWKPRLKRTHAHFNLSFVILVSQVRILHLIQIVSALALTFASSFAFGACCRSLCNVSLVGRLWLLLHHAHVEPDVVFRYDRDALMSSRIASLAIFGVCLFLFHLSRSALLRLGFQTHGVGVTLWVDSQAALLYHI